MIVFGKVCPQCEMLHQFERYKRESNYNQLQRICGHYDHSADKVDPIILCFSLDPSMKCSHLVIENVPIVDRVCDRNHTQDFERHDDGNVPIEDCLMIRVD